MTTFSDKGDNTLECGVPPNLNPKTATSWRCIPLEQQRATGIFLKILMGSEGVLWGRHICFLLHNDCALPPFDHGTILGFVQDVSASCVFVCHLVPKISYVR